LAENIAANDADININDIFALIYGNPSESDWLKSDKLT